MRRTLLLTILTVTFSSFVPAQSTEQLDKCMDKARTQLDLHLCADGEAKRVDAELNSVYQQLLSTALNDSGAIEKIRAAESAWIGYRDAYLEATYPAENKLAAYGSMYTTEILLLRTKLTRQQTDALRDMLKRYSGSR